MNGNEHKPDEGEAAVAIDELVFRFLEACDGSEAAPSTVLDSICREHPDSAAELRAAVDVLSGTGLGLSGDGSNGDLRTVAGYRLLERLGAGGMGVVYRARRAGETADVAVKLLHPQIQSEPEARDRFAREASAIESLDHPSIVRVIDHGEVHEGKSGGVTTPYIAMAFHRGATLDRAVAWMRRDPIKSRDGSELGERLHSAIAPDVDPIMRSSRLRGPWWEIVARLGADLASALEHAHESGVVHRDVKPSNVLVAPDGRVLLLDFGLALTSSSGRLTRSGAQLGSLPYMAPEQLAGRTTSALVDVYGLGLVLYELLTLTPAFAMQNAEGLAVAIDRGKSFRPSKVAPWIPVRIAASLDAIIECATQRDPAHRYASARELKLDLLALTEGRPVSVQPLGAVARATRTARRYPWQVAICAVILGFLILGASLFFFYESRAAEDERRSVAAEVTAIEGRLESLQSGFVGLSVGPLGDDPKFAPTALGALMGERDEMLSARERLSRLAEEGEDVADLAWQADRLLADVLMEIANAQSTLGKGREAIESYRARLAHVEKMADARSEGDSRGELALRAELGRSFAMLARAIQLSGSFDTALKEATRGVEIIEEVRARGHSPIVSSSQLISALLIQSEAHVRSGERAAAAEALDRAEAVSIDAFGPEPESLRYRGQRGEIELRRTVMEFSGEHDKASIERLQRSIRWLDESRQSIADNSSLAVIRIDAGIRLAVALRRERRFDEAVTTLQELTRLNDRILAARGGEPAPGDPFVALGERARMVAARIEADRSDDEGRAESIAIFWEAHERAKVAFRERPDSAEALVRYLHTTGVYVNQAVRRTSVEPWQLERALEVVKAALDETAGADEAVRQIYGTRRLCQYAYGLALVRASRVKATMESADALEAKALQQTPVDAFGLRMSADLWSELLASQLASEGANPRISQEVAALRERTLDLLEAAVAAGFDDSTDLQTTEALDPLREDPRFRALMASVEAARSDD